MAMRPVDRSTSLLESLATFGDMLKYLRRRARLTQSELAIAVGYSREQITKLENNQRLPDLATLAALFVPALDLEGQPGLLERFVALAAVTRTVQKGAQEEAERVNVSSRTSRTNLPASLTRFVGRGREMAEVRRLLATTRLLTLIGVGGVGKTRLALQIGIALQEDFADGVWLAELASLVEPTLVPSAVALALGIAPASAQPIDTAIANYLSDKQLLLILDNCEHLLDACAALGATLLRGAAQLRILATSREALGVLGETAWQILPLSLPALSPATDTPPVLEHSNESEAVQLFVERATAAQPGFALTQQNAPTVAQLCHRLDGIPLAIELAATHVRVMSVQELAARLDDRFRLLTSGNRTAMPRQQTLRALIDWSYDLLSEPERALLQQLSVFAGGWTLAAAERIGGDGGVLDLLTLLVNKSLIVVDEGDNATRYRLLETIGVYGREKLTQAGAEQDARRRHLSYYGWLAEQAAPHLKGLYHGAWHTRLEVEHMNLRAALAWAAEHDLPAALHLIANLWYFWLWSGYWSEGLAWADRALGATASQRTEARAWALIGGAVLAGRTGDEAKLAVWLAEGAALAEALGERECAVWARIIIGLSAQKYAQAEALLAESVALAEAAQNNWLAAMARFVLGERARSHGDHERATSLYIESLALFRAVGDRLMVAWPLGNLGRLALQSGDYKRAQAAFEESVALCRAAGNKLGAADWLVQVATAALYQCEYTRAQAALGECLPLSRDLGHDGAIADCLVIAAGIAEAKGSGNRAAALLAVADTIFERFRLVYRVVDPASYAEYTRRLATVRADLDEQSFAAAWSAGRAMTLAQAAEYVLSVDASEPSAHI